MNKISISLTLLLLITINNFSMDLETTTSTEVSVIPKKARTKTVGLVEKGKKIKSDLFKRYIKNKSIRILQEEKKESEVKVKSAEKIFKCRYCINGYQYSSKLKGNVLRHEEYHFVKGKYACECGCKFQHRGGLGKHRLDIHGIR